MATLKGIAVMAGAGGLVFTAGIVSGTNPSLTQKFGATRDAEHVYLKSAVGDSVADFITNRKRNVTITVVPYHATTLAGARTNNSAYRLAAGTVITLTDTSEIAEGNYLLVSSKENRTNDGFVSIDLELTNRDDNDVTLTPT